ncbi:MAG TPA: phosphoribosylamine--glycine ligase [Nitrososphaerales archaeon]|nr:phosphoribosylamine--glycine ligase [Nitrososphaerales archaeon]
MADGSDLTRKGEAAKRNVLIVGSGGREHALAWKIRRSKIALNVYVAPGNGGTAEFSIPIGSTDMKGLADFASKNDCFTVVGPEVPLSLGIVDSFEEQGLPIFGPTRQQAMLETSKSYAKRFMKENGIPTARFEVFRESGKATDYASRFEGRVAVKADGLAAGKGVFVCSSMEEAEQAISSILEKRTFGDAGGQVVVEERLEGREVSLMALCDGKKAVPFGTATDHKRLLDGDAGPNTGGMGAYSPSRDFGYDRIEEVMKSAIYPTVSKTSYRGFLYAGLMLTDSGVKVLEFNARLGDPETQAILPRLDSDLLFLLFRAYMGGTESDPSMGLVPSWSPRSCCTIAMCSSGYPGNPVTGDEIRGLDSVMANDICIFHSGTKRVNNRLVTSGGRVVYVTSLGNSVEEAAKKAYEAVEKISWKGEYHRKDIGIHSPLSTTL